MTWRSTNFSPNTASREMCPHLLGVLAQNQVQSHDSQMMHPSFYVDPLTLYQASLSGKNSWTVAYDHIPTKGEAFPSYFQC